MIEEENELWNLIGTMGKTGTGQGSREIGAIAEWKKIQNNRFCSMYD